MKYITRMSFLVILLLAGVTGIAAADEKIPVIYCTDLFHPHDDPDDHFDAACMYAIPEFDIKAVILDQGKRQQQQRGSIPMEQLNGLTGRNVPYVVGLAETLENPEDTGGNQSAEYQDGIKTILSVLRESPEPVTIITVGSLRDVAAAYNREPQLFRDKLYRLYSFIGEAQGVMREYNVGLDIHAYRCIMNSGLPVYWVPCFDGGVWVNEGNASFWKAKHNDLLADVSDTVLNFFIYMAVRKNDPKPMAALYTPVVPKEKEKVLEAMRNLWCCAVFPYMAGRKYIQRGDIFLAVPEAEVLADDKSVQLFSFLPVKVRVDENGVESYGENGALQTVHRFHVTDFKSYAAGMTSIARELLRELSGRVVPKS